MRLHLSPALQRTSNRLARLITANYGRSWVCTMRAPFSFIKILLWPDVIPGWPAFLECHHFRSYFSHNLMKTRAHRESNWTSYFRKVKRILNKHEFHPENYEEFQEYYFTISIKRNLAYASEANAQYLHFSFSFIFTFNFEYYCAKIADMCND